ncbi:hypothetical protein [Pantoea agglomerans]|jgi:hypothetical protein|uniref:hypothetical protein n=1 Tax=Enterobacter agglomerans TaxID=549 RepID=UPI003FCFD612
MEKVKAHTLDDAIDKLKNDECKGVLIDFDISADEFFVLFYDLQQKSTKIEKSEGRFFVKKRSFDG